MPYGGKNRNRNLPTSWEMENRTTTLKSCSAGSMKLHCADGPATLQLGS